MSRFSARKFARLAIVVAGMASMLLIAGPIPAMAASGPPHGGGVVTQPVQLRANTRSVAVSKIVATGDTRNVLVTGWVNLFNSSASGLKVTLSFYHTIKGQQSIHTEKEVVYVAAHSYLTVPVGMQCNELGAGSYEFGVMAKPTGNITLQSASLTVVGLGSPGNTSYLPNAFATRTRQLKLQTSPTTVLQTTLTVGAAGLASVASPTNALGQGWVNVIGGSKKSTIKLDYYMDSQLMGSVSQIVGPDQPVSIPFALLCNGLSAGNHVFTVKLTASFAGPITRSGFLSVAGLPTDGTIPNSSFNGDGKPVALGTKVTQLLQAKLDTTQVSDVWMGGWIGLNNSTNKPRTVTVQAAMGGGAEGPALRVTVPKHGRLAVPFGLLCNGEPAGSMTLDVLVTSSGPGVSYTGDGNLSSWAVAP